MQVLFTTNKSQENIKETRKKKKKKKKKKRNQKKKKKKTTNYFFHCLIPCRIGKKELKDDEKKERNIILWRYQNNENAFVFIYIYNETL